MYAVEFQAPVKNGVVRIPENYHSLYESREVRVFIISVKDDKKQASFEPKDFFGLANKSKKEIDQYLQSSQNEWDSYLDEK